MSDQLGHPQVGERQLELAFVESSMAPASRIDSGLERPRLVPVSLHALRGCSNDTDDTAASDRAVDHQAGAAETVEVLELR